MKRLTVLWTILVALGLAVGAAAETKVMAVTDIHYLARPLYEYSEIFVEILKGGDGKLTQYGDELLDALYLEIQEEKPDALLMTGDLSFNGEKQSHFDLAAWFSKVEASGVPVWVIPGNHDMSTRPAGFSRRSYYAAESVNEEEFKEIYQDFMLPGGVGCSYIAPVSDELWALMTDVTYCPQAFGVFMKAHAHPGPKLSVSSFPAQSAGISTVLRNQKIPFVAGQTSCTRLGSRMFFQEVSSKSGRAHTATPPILPRSLRLASRVKAAISSS